MNVQLAGLLGYVALQLLLGLIVSRRVASETDFWIAGRRLGPALATFSIFATWFGAESCIGASGAAYAGGLAGATADPFGYAACLLLMGLVFAVPLRRRELVTLADLFRQRFGERVERLAAVLMVPSSILWAAAQIRALGAVLAASSELDAALATTFAAFVVILYTASGGLLADAATDLLQGIVLLLGLAFVAFAIVGDLGGAEVALATVRAADLRWVAPERSLFSTLEAWAVPIFGSVVAQELVARVVAARSPSLARSSTLAAGVMYLGVGLIPVSLGLIGAGMLPGLEQPERILPLLAQLHLGDLGYVIFAGALVSAILSTVDSCLLAASSLTCHNLIVPLRRDLSERSKLRVARAGVVAYGALAYVLALRAGAVYELVETASAFASAGVFVILAFGLSGRFGGAASAVAALLVGAGVWLAGSYGGLLEHPYLWSLGAATGAYLGVAAFWRGREDGRGVVESAA